MQTSSDEDFTREDIESRIEFWKESIYDQRYALRWFNLSLNTLGLGVVISVVIYAILIPLNILILQPILQVLGAISSIVSTLPGIGIVASYFTYNEYITHHQKELREDKRSLAQFLRVLARYDEYALNNLTSEQYMHQLPTLIASYRKQADSYRRRYIIIQIITILLSATITSLSGGWLDKYVSVPWIIPVCSAFISILTSFTLFFRYREKGTNLQQTSDAMDLEHKACNLGIGLYKGMTKTDALILLAERTEQLRKDQQQRQLQLEQSSHAQQKALQADN